LYLSLKGKGSCGVQDATLLQLRAGMVTPKLPDEDVTSQAECAVLQLACP
jgi:hypothetical protein